MAQWRLGLAIVMLLLLTKIDAKADDEEEDDDDMREDTKSNKIASARRNDEPDDEDEDDNNDDDDEEGAGEKNLKEAAVGGGLMADVPTTATSQRANILVPSKPGLPITRTPKKRPLECYVCSYKIEQPLRACLDPTKFRVHTITCHSVEDKCFTSVVSKGETYEAILRGCRSNCVGSPETTCCDHNRCNNQAFAMPLIQPREVLTHSEDSKAKTCAPPSILFFVSILLLLQTVMKVAIV